MPEAVKAQAVASFRLFLSDPQHPSLRWHRLKDNKKGDHRDGTISVSINMQYRALYVEREGRNVWYWVGTKAEHDIFTGIK